MEWIKRVDYYGVCIMQAREYKYTNGTIIFMLTTSSVSMCSSTDHSVTTGIELLLCHNGAAG